MRSLAGRICGAALVLLFLALQVDGLWKEFIADRPGGTLAEFARYSAPELRDFGLGVLLIIGVAVVAAFALHMTARLTAPSKLTPPPANAGPGYAVRAFPVHTLICVLLTAGALAAFFPMPWIATILTGLAIMAWVGLARRMGLGQDINTPTSVETR